MTATVSILLIAFLVALWAAVVGLSLFLTARWRKFAYAGLILVLFFAMLIHRNQVEEAADQNDLRETNLGEVDLGGSTARFALAGLRGPLICGLWWEAIDRQSRHEWDKLELLYKALTKLQPHFRSPWTYQAWNLAYNVSVEFDRVEDKYFYIAEGVSWQAQGERTNRARVYDPHTGQHKVVGDPDMRWFLGFMIQQKMTVSDEVSTHRCFLHLSCIPPDTWDPTTLRGNPSRFQEFKRAYPQLVRRIRELRQVPEGAEAQLDREILAFFAAHRRIPSLYPEEARTGNLSPEELARLKRFPIWPDDPGLVPENPEVERFHDPHDIARNWYEFSVRPLPPPGTELQDDPTAEWSTRRFRMPQGMVSLIFRSRPAQARSLQATGLAKDGWFRASQGGTPGSQEVWAIAHEDWLRFGHENDLELPAGQYEELFRKANRYQRRFPDEARRLEPPPRHLSDTEAEEEYRAMRTLFALSRRRGLANYEHWRVVSEVGRKPEHTRAREHVYVASKHLSDLKVALREYEKGIALWKGLLVRPRTPRPEEGDFVSLLALSPYGGPQFALVGQPAEYVERTPFGQDSQVQDETLELQDGYMRLRAKSEAPDWMDSGILLSEVSQLLGHQCTAGSPGLAAMSLPAASPPASLEAIEELLRLRDGPLDRYLSPDHLRNRAIRDRASTPSGESSPPATTAPGTTAPKPEK